MGGGSLNRAWLMVVVEQKQDDPEAEVTLSAMRSFLLSCARMADRDGNSKTWIILYPKLYRVHLFFSLIQCNDFITSFLQNKKTQSLYEGKKYPIGTSQSIASGCYGSQKGYAQRLQKWQQCHETRSSKAPTPPFTQVHEGGVFGIHRHWVN